MWRNKNNNKIIILAAAITILLCAPICAQVAIPNDNVINNQEKTNLSEQQNDVFDAKDVINYVEKRINSVKNMPESAKERAIRKLHSATTEALINEQLEESNNIAVLEKIFNRPETEKITDDGCEDLFAVFTGTILGSVAYPSSAIMIPGVFFMIVSSGGSGTETGSLYGPCEWDYPSYMEMYVIVGGMLTVPALHLINIQNINIILGFGVYVLVGGA